MKLRVPVAGALVVGATWVGLVVPAGAAPGKDTIGGANAVVVGNVRIDAQDPSVAYLTARYVCPEGESHLWVSVKQTDDGRPDNALKEEASSQHSDAWLQSHRNDYTCDGAWHTATFTVDTVDEGGFGGFGTLDPGQVYVQFCLTGPGGDETAPPDWWAIDRRFAPAN